MKWITKIEGVVCLLFVLSATPVLSALMPPGRLPGGVLWSANKVGVVGGIPDVTTIYTNLWPTNTTADINNALSSCPSNEVVYLNAGTYHLGELTLARSGVVLRGAGTGKTILANAGYIQIFAAGYGWYGYGPTTNNAIQWTSGYAQGMTNITIASPTNVASGGASIAVGNIIALTQENDTNLINIEGNQGNPQHQGVLYDGTSYCNEQQYVVVTAVNNGTNLTIWPGVYMTNIQSSLRPQITWTGTGNMRMSGVEDLTIDESSGGVGTSIGIMLINAYNCWIKNVEVSNTCYAAFAIDYSAHDTVEGCYAHDCASGGFSTTYGVNPHASSDILMDNNIFYKITCPCQVDSGASGCVFAYNFCTNMEYGYSPGWLASSINTHGAHPDMNLFEGNIGTAINYDYIHGSSSHNTCFRNYFSGFETNLNNYTNWYPANTFPVDIDSTNRYMSFIGNVLGTVGYHVNYQEDVINGFPTNLGSHTIYRIGYEGANYTSGDPQTVTTLWRDGNWDAVNQTTLWDSNGAVTLPPSLYLTAQPSWWSNSVPWPPIGPDVSPKVNPIPAELRFEAMMDATTNNPAQSGVSPPSGLTVIGTAQ